VFDNAYYQNLQQGKGLLHSDQALFSTKGSNVATVNQLASDNVTFLGDFADAMIKMDDISPLTGKQGQIRVNCHKVNSPAISEMDSTDIDTLIALE
jgi:peroxidase